MLRNVFGEAVLFFKDTSLESTRKAWREANVLAEACSGVVSMYRPPRVRGQWDNEAAVVGHRRYEDIMKDCEESAQRDDHEANVAAHEEMDQLSERWRGLVEPGDMH